jgi:S-formylglutathione hydrolase FrmB
MNRIKATLFLLIATMLTLLLAQCAQRENPAIPETPAGGTILQASHDFSSIGLVDDIDRAQHRARWVVAYVPPGYKKDVVGQRYPTLYLLPGYDGVPSFLFKFGNENYYRVADIAVVADRLIAAGEIKPMIIVTPDASIFYGGSFYANSSLEGPWELMMSDSLVAYIDRTYLTIPEKESRAISGHSSGGYGAVRLAMTRPGMYNSVSAMDAPLSFDGLTALFDDYLNESNIDSQEDYLNTDTTGFRDQPYKKLFYSMAATFSPSGVRDETYPFTTLQIGLPFDFTGSAIDTIWNKWLANDLYRWLDSSSYQAAMSAQNLYFESSHHSSMGFDEQTRAFEARLSELGIAYTSASYESYEGYDAHSRSHIYDRLEFILKFHDQYLRDRFGNF